MAYATQQNIIDRYGEDALSALADRDVDGEIDETSVSDALDDASEEIDSYIGVKHPLPLSSTPGSVVRACIDIALYNLAGSRTTEEIKDRFNRAISWLRDVSKGTATLGDHPAESAPSQASFVASDRVTGRSKMTGGF